MKRILSLPLLSFLFLTFAACERDDEVDTFDGIKVIAEPLSSGAKVAVDGTRGTWTAGEQIRINSSVETVEYHDGSAYIPYDSPQEVNRALYPASLTASSLSSDLVNVTFPAEYHYQTSGGHQILELPMAARSSGRNPLHFHHLTGALCFLVINDEASTPLTLQSITVVSSGYRLNGTRRINIASPDTTSALSASVAADRTVKMYFDHGLVVPAGDTARVMIPVAPVGADNRFTVTVKYFQDGTNNSFKFSRTQSTGGALQRNQLGYAPTNIHTTTGVNITPASFFERVSGDFIINTPLDFILMDQACNNNWKSPDPNDYYYNSSYILMNNIDMSEYSFSPLKTLKGTIDGNSKDVNNLKIVSCQESPSSPNNYICALLADSKGSIKDITFNNLVLRHNDNITGYLKIAGLFASVTEDLTLRNCTVNIDAIEIIGSVATYIYFGGLVADNGKKLIIDNCHISTPSANWITSGRSIYCGGMIASGGSNDISITSSSWVGTINLESNINMWAGGIVGQKNGKFTATDCIVNGTINAIAHGSYNLASVIGKYYSPSTYDITGTTPSVTIVVNDSPITVVEYN